MTSEQLDAHFLFRDIREEEADEAAQVEQICFPPHEACSREHMIERVHAAPDRFLVAIDRDCGRIAGFLNGLATEENGFRDEFFTDASLYDPRGSNIMLLGLDVLPGYRRQGLARELVRRYILRERKRGVGRLYLTCLEDKVRMYQSFGFLDNGMADSSWGGEKWHEMYCELPENPVDDEAGNTQKLH